MRSGAKPDNLLERALLTAGLVPTPFLDTFIGLLLVRTVSTATKWGVFEALADSDLTCETLSERSGTGPRASGERLDSSVASDHPRRESGRYGLAPTARKWVLADSPKSLRDPYFAFTGESGSWAAEEMAQWQLQAGLRVRNPIRLRRSPGAIIRVGIKPDGPPRRGGRGA